MSTRSRVGIAASLRNGSTLPRIVVASTLTVSMLGGCTSDKATLTQPTTTNPNATPSTATTTGGESNCGSHPGRVTVPYRVVDGVAKNLTSLDVYAPAKACKAPVVVWVHGGGYVRGDKRNQIADKVTLFNEHGWVLVSVNYRLTRPSRQPGDDHGAQYPDHFEDVAASIAWIRSNIAQYGGDPKRIAALGHSAGADIVSNIAANPAYLAEFQLEPSALRCVGILDTAGLDKTVSTVRDTDGENQQWKQALGNVADYLTATSATQLVEAGGGFPTALVVIRGSIARRMVQEHFVDTLKAAAVAVSTIDASGYSHTQVNAKIGAAGDRVMTAPLVTFLEGCFSR